MLGWGDPRLETAVCRLCGERVRLWQFDTHSQLCDDCFQQKHRLAPRPKPEKP